jgi:hypothetical protein
LERFPPVEVTLPWLTPDSPKDTKRLVFTGPAGTASRSNGFNGQVWKPALVAAGIIAAPTRTRASPCGSTRT